MLKLKCIAFAILLVPVAVFFVQCSSKKQVVHQEMSTSKLEMPSRQYGLTVASEQVDCYGVSKQKCFLTKPSWGNKWEYMYSTIEGFTYEQGYEYLLEIKETEIKNPVADTSSKHYTLVNIISKTKKDSDIRMEHEKPTFDSTWDLAQLNGKDIKGYIVFTSKGSLAANAGCNTLRGIQYEVDATDHRISFHTEKGASTRMFCEGNRDEEFKNALSKVTHYEEVSKNKLLLKEQTMTLIELKR